MTYGEKSKAVSLLFVSLWFPTYRIPMLNALCNLSRSRRETRRTDTTRGRATQCGKPRKSGGGISACRGRTSLPPSGANLTLRNTTYLLMSLSERNAAAGWHSGETAAIREAHEIWERLPMPRPREPVHSSRYSANVDQAQ